MKLYYKAGACSLASHIVLEETGLPYETEAVDLKTKVTASGADFTQINAKGYVPALVLDTGELLTEGPAILQYLADRVPEKKLVPADGTLERYRLQSWLTFIGTELHRSCTPSSAPLRVTPGRLRRWPTLSAGSTTRTANWRARRICWATVSAWPMPTFSPC